MYIYIYIYIYNPHVPSFQFPFQTEKTNNFRSDRPIQFSRSDLALSSLTCTNTPNAGLEWKRVEFEFDLTSEPFGPKSGRLRVTVICVFIIGGWWLVRRYTEKMFLST